MQFFRTLVLKRHFFALNKSKVTNKKDKKQEKIKFFFTYIPNRKNRKKLNIGLIMRYLELYLS